MKKVCIFIILLWSSCSYGGLFSSFGDRVKQICSKGFWGGKSRGIFVDSGRLRKEPEKRETGKTEAAPSLFVLVVRHASYRGTLDVKGRITREQAEAYGLSDVRLQLSKEGKEKFMEMCKARNFCSFDLLIHSPSVRAWETANIFSDYFAVRERRMSDNLSERYSEPEEILQEIRATRANTVVLVGHQPSLTKFLSEVLSEESATMAHILLNSYGSMIPLKFSSWEFGSAELQF